MKKGALVLLLLVGFIQQNVHAETTNEERLAKIQYMLRTCYKFGQERQKLSEQLIDLKKGSTQEQNATEKKLILQIEDGIQKLDAACN